MGRMVRAELQKYFHTPGGAVSTLVWMALIILIQWLTLVNVADENVAPTILEPRHAFDIALPGMAILGALLAPLIGAVIVGQEFRYGTWNLLLMQAGNRLRVFGAKAAALVIVTAIWVALGIGIGYVASLSNNALLFWPPVSVVVLKQAGVVFAGMLFWGGLAFALAVAFRSTTAAVVVGFIHPWAEMFLQNIPGVGRWLPSVSYSAVLTPQFLGNPEGIVTANLNPAAPAVSVAWMILALEFAIILFWGALAVRWTAQR